MKTDAKWTGSGYPLPKRWALKSDVPRMNAGVRAIRLEFRFEVAYVALDEQRRVLMQNDQWLPCWDFHLVKFGRVIGPQDFASADNSEMQEAWRSSGYDLRSDQINLKTLPTE